MSFIFFLHYIYESKTKEDDFIIFKLLFTKIIILICTITILSIIIIQYFSTYYKIKNNLKNKNIADINIDNIVIDEDNITSKYFNEKVKIIEVTENNLLRCQFIQSNKYFNKNDFIDIKILPINSIKIENKKYTITKQQIQNELKNMEEIYVIFYLDNNNKIFEFKDNKICLLFLKNSNDFLTIKNIEKNCLNYLLYKNAIIENLSN